MGGACLTFSRVARHGRVAMRIIRCPASSGSVRVPGVQGRTTIILEPLWDPTLGHEGGDRLGRDALSDLPKDRHVAARSEVMDSTAFTAALRDRIGERKHEMWFGTSTTIARDAEQLVVEAPSDFAAQWIHAHYRDALESCAREVVGSGCAVQIRVRGSAGEPPVPPVAQKTPSARERPATPQPTPATLAALSPHRVDGLESSWRNFADFIVGDSNRLAYESARHMAQSDDASLKLLCVHGACGVGKTHLLQSICRTFRQRRPVAKVRYVTGEQFTNEYIAGVREGTIESLRKRLRRLDLLVIDDVHFLANKTGTQSECLHTIDAIGYAGSKVVLATDAHPREIARLSPPLVSRFLAGMVVKVEDPDRETRRALAMTFADRRQTPMTPEAIDLLIDRAGGNAREIEGAVMTVAALRSLEPGDGMCTRLLVERALGRRSIGTSGRPVRVIDIVTAVCTTTGVEREDLVGKGRHRRVVTARALAAHLAREMTTLSYPEIADALGRSTHSTVHAAAGRFREMVDRDEPCTTAGDIVRAADLTERTRREILRARP